MRLSEAIRLGAMLKPQGFGGFYPADHTSCALGAAADASGFVPAEPDLPSVGILEFIRARWPWAEKRVLACPLGCEDVDYDMASAQYTETTLARAIVAHLNDDHRWTRERIAEWVATIEPAEVLPMAQEANASVSA